jgi:L-aspartate oxidase
MTAEVEPRRYLVDIDSAATEQLFTDCLVIGAGIAGLRAAIEAAESRNVIIVCKSGLADSNTWQAQGGIASVLDKDDSFESHINDTLNTGCGLCEPDVVELVVRQGPKLIAQLQDWGTEFDLTNGRIATTIEGGHSHPRIAHAHGDETGRFIAQTLIKKVTENPKIKVIENFFTTDLLTNDNNDCIGIIGSCNRKPQIIWSEKTILATGGTGQLYRETTNPDVATADGLAMAYRAGAILQDLEFMQFHPTTLYVAGASRALITETLRGEGAVLLDVQGRRFMKKYHPDAELAPRDIVSRAILEQMVKTNSTHVFLDVRHFDKEHFKKRFPLISELCESFDIDVRKDLIPVRPSAHYMVGGVKTNITAQTTIKNLYACGEVAATGLHGANRLGSNSLLEGLVFGKIAGRQTLENSISTVSNKKHPKIIYRNSLRSLMWRNAGITRNGKKLTEAQETIRFWQRYVMDKIFDSPTGWECQNMLTIALLMAQIAEKRRESRGVHFRSDFPRTDDKNFKKHIEIVRTDRP